MEKGELYGLSCKSCIERAAKRGFRYCVNEPTSETNEYLTGKTKFFKTKKEAEDYYKDKIEGCVRAVATEIETLNFGIKVLHLSFYKTEE